MNKVKPIKPDEVDGAKVIPDEVIKAFNTLIAKEWDGRSAILRQGDVIKEIGRNLKASGKVMARSELFDEHYLDVEEIFRQEGWKVHYDKPAYNEDYEPSWTFQKK